MWQFVYCLPLMIEIWIIVMNVELGTYQCQSLYGIAIGDYEIVLNFSEEDSEKWKSHIQPWQFINGSAYNWASGLLIF